MAKRDDNFGFDTDSKPKAQKEINLEFLNNIKFLDKLTYKQKEIAFFSAIIVVILVISIAVGCIVVGVNGGFGGNNAAGGNNTNNNTENNNSNENNTEGDNGDNEENGDTEEDETIKVPETITSFYITSQPNKLEYYVGEDAVYSGLRVVVRSGEDELVVNYDDDPESFTITGFDSSAPVEEQIITVECRGFKDTFNIQILETEMGQARLIGISLSGMPRTLYQKGESFDTTGGIICAEYSDGTYKYTDLTMKHIFGFGAIANTPGTHQVKIKFSDGNGGYAETTFEVTITE